MKYLTIIRALLEEYVDFPELEVPDFSDRDIETMEEVAEKIREAWSIGDKPIKDIIYLLKTIGFVISSLTLGSKKIDAFGSQQ